MARASRKKASPEQTIVLTVSRRFTASAEQVFDAWLDSKALGRWLFATPGGIMKKVEVDPRVGGTFTISEQRGDVLAEHFGTYLEIERPKRIVLAFATEPGQRPTKVTVTLVPAGKGCELTLVHEMEAQWADYTDRARNGWTMILDSLSNVLEEKQMDDKGLMSARTVVHDNFTMERTLAAPPDRVFFAWSDPAAKRRWFAEGEGWEVQLFDTDFRVGGREKSVFRFRGGEPISNDSTYLEIVPGQRIVLVYTMATGGKTFSASLLTAEFYPSGRGTRLVITEQGAYLDPGDKPVSRRGGFEGLINQLEKELDAHAA